MALPSLPAIENLRNPVHLAWLAVVLVLGLGAWQIYLSWSLLTAPAAPSEGQLADSRQAPVAFDLHAVAATDLFGRAESRGDELPETSQALVLRAAFVSPRRESAGAIIESSDGKAQWYRSGNTLPGGAVLEEVREDHVLLKINGRRETLRFPSITELAVARSVNSPQLDDSDALPEPERSTTRRVDEPISNLPAEDKARAVRSRLEELRNRSRT